jgi:2-desacetyl-2-hydroxyethyl bacteriochlorophyllide A dehydrogenase
VGVAVAFTGPREVALLDHADVSLGQDELRVQTIYSGISAGTELTAYRGSNPYLHKRWDDARRLFLEEAQTFEYPLTAWGYEEVGRVVEVGGGADGVSVGDLVWGTWGHRSSAVVGARSGGVLPTAVPPLAGIFARIGAIALNAVLDADIHVGETVAIFGQGVPGLIATQLARLNGATVVAVDGIARRLELAQRLGAAHAIDVARQSPAEAIKELTDGRGADVSIEFSGAYSALNEAIRATAYNSRVVASGFFQGEGSALRLGEEFHHNRIEIVCSQISGRNARLDHRWSVARLERTIMTLQADGRIDLEALVSHVLPATDAAEAFRLLDERPAETVQVVLDFQAVA